MGPLNNDRSYPSNYTQNSNFFNYMTSKIIANSYGINNCFPEEDIVEIKSEKTFFSNDLDHLENLNDRVLREIVKIAHRTYPKAITIKAYTFTLLPHAFNKLDPQNYYEFVRVLFGHGKFKIQGAEAIQEVLSGMKLSGKCYLNKTSKGEIEHYKTPDCNVCEQVMVLFKKSSTKSLFFSAYSSKED